MSLDLQVAEEDGRNSIMLASSFELRASSFELRASSFELRASSFELRASIAAIEGIC